VSLPPERLKLAFGEALIVMPDVLTEAPVPPIVI
jgi:hypothetical protein